MKKMVTTNPKRVPAPRNPQMNVIRRNETTVLWTVKGRTYKCQILPQTCPMCKKTGTWVALPPPLRDVQPDGTNVVCFHVFGGCNHGFELMVDPDTLTCRWEVK